MTSQNKANHFIFPKPSGFYSVGKQTFQLTDTTRPEPYLPESSQMRELMITAWYPANQESTMASPYAPAFQLDSLKHFLGMQQELTREDLSALDDIRLHATDGVAVSGKQDLWPLIIFSHGYHGSRFYYQALFEELASHGYIVIAIDHTYDAGVTQFPDGSLQSFKQLTLAPTDSDEFYDSFKTRLAIRQTDIQFVIATIKAKGNEVFAEVDTSKIGLFGHSLGAEAALQTAAHDRQIGAVVAMDSFPVGATLPATFNKPCMMLHAELIDWHKMPMSDKKRAEIDSQIKAYQEHAHWSILFKSADHLIFSDFAILNDMSLFQRLPKGSMFSIGAVDGLQTTAMLRNYLVAFFDKTLKNSDQTLLQNNLQDKYLECIVHQQ